MLRNALRLLLVVLAIALLRYAFVAIAKAMSGRRDPEEPAARRRAPKQEVPGGELQRDPVCGTYVAPSSSVKLEIEGTIRHFCSPQCRDKFLAASKV
ncbi:MAG: YHS domain-containing protein [Bryobacterales bacterium]|nr:YHS domain-containing protein [Bryobacterales bacterium]